MALRVTLVDMPPAFDSFEGEVHWVGEPEEVCELSGVTDPDSPSCAGKPTFWAAELQCEAFYHDWQGSCVAGTCSQGLKPGES